MSILRTIRQLVEDPPPEFLFEFSQAGIAWAHRHAGLSHPLRGGFQPLPPGVLHISPVRDNVLNPEALEQAVFQLVPPSPNKRRRRCALILPDYCARVAVLDFDSFPSEPAEQMSLVRFRVKKSVPFDLDAANVSFHVQPHPAGGKKRDVLVVVVSQEILARFEAPLRMAGLHPGIITLSTLSALNLLHSTTLDVTAKLTGNALTVCVSENNALRMYRCVELESLTTEAILAILFPTCALIEDEHKRKPSTLHLCGFGSSTQAVARELAEELGIPVQLLAGPHGPLSPFNAGLIGHLAASGLSLEEAAA